MHKIQSSFFKNPFPVIRTCNWYFCGLVFLLAAASVLFLFTGKAGSFISLNSYHPFLLNVFFINYTFLGDGIFACCLIGFCLYKKKKQLAIALLLSFLFSGIIVQLIKNLVNAPRPRAFFEAGQYLYFIDGISRTGYSSFPSGHTATAFAIAAVIVLMMKNKKWQIQILSAAALVGYSRIYLAQHFLPDIIFGMLIGSLCAIAATWLVLNAGRMRYPFPGLYRKKSKDRNQSPQSIQTA